MPRRTKKQQEQRSEARETLERRWHKRLRDTPQLAKLVVADAREREPFHRWLPYKQAFAPALVRAFLEQAGCLLPDTDRPDLRLLDPFAGSGTFAIECARHDAAATGIEALDVLVFLANARSAREFPPPPRVLDSASWQEIAADLHDPIHRAALIAAYARQHAADGRPLRAARPIAALFREVCRLIADDLITPLPRPVDVRRGDARRLTDIADESIGGILTSPPYLSRHDYTRITRPHDLIYRHAYAADPLAQQRHTQVRAHPAARAQRWQREMPAAVREICANLELAGDRKPAGVVRSYFEDMFAALDECRSVLAPGAPFWLVIGGARFRDAYVPADLILAEYAETIGLDVRGVRVARRLVPTGRRLGRLTDVAPREILLVIRKAE